jgi:hypothetical protein
VFGRAQPGSDLKVLWSIKLNAQVLGLEVEHFVGRRSFNVSYDYLYDYLYFLRSFLFIYISLSRIFKTEGGAEGGDRTITVGHDLTIDLQQIPLAK